MMRRPPTIGEVVHVPVDFGLDSWETPRHGCRPAMVIATWEDQCNVQIFLAADDAIPKGIMDIDDARYPRGYSRFFRYECGIAHRVGADATPFRTWHFVHECPHWKEKK